MESSVFFHLFKVVGDGSGTYRKAKPFVFFVFQKIRDVGLKDWRGDRAQGVFHGSAYNKFPTSTVMNISAGEWLPSALRV